MKTKRGVFGLVSGFGGATRDGRGGQVIVIAAFALLLLCMIAAVMVDVGYMFCAEAQLQNASDAASVAAAHKLCEERNGGSAETTARTAAQDEAEAFASINNDQARCEVVFGSYSNGSFVTLGDDTQATAIRVRVLRDDEAPGGPLGLFFAPITGLSSVRVRSKAVSEMSTGVIGVKAGSDLRPFAVYEGDVAGWQAGQPVTIELPQGGAEEGQLTPGNWGWLNLDGGAQGTNELSHWIRNGYDGDITLNQTGDDGRLCTWIDGSCGVRHALQNDFQSLLGETILLCIFDDVTGQGANTDFRIVGFLAMVMTGIDFHGQNGTIEGRMNALTNVPYVEMGEGASEESNVCRIRLVE